MGNKMHVGKTEGRSTIDIKPFECDNGKLLDPTLLNDLVADCGPDAEDEPILKSLLTLNTYYPCIKPDMIPCREGHSKCYVFTDICAYKLSRVYKYIIPCRNGKHLQNCTMFECNMMFKCIKSYCILWTFVCDGKWDCPEGDGEILSGMCGKDLFCNKMYKCKGTKKYAFTWEMYVMDLTTAHTKMMNYSVICRKLIAH